MLTFITTEILLIGSYSEKRGTRGRNINNSVKNNRQLDRINQIF